MRRNRRSYSFQSRRHSANTEVVQLMYRWLEEYAGPQYATSSDRLASMVFEYFRQEEPSFNKISSKELHNLALEAAETYMKRIHRRRASTRKAVEGYQVRKGKTITRRRNSNLRRSARDLGPEYNIPISFGVSDHELLASLHRGQGDPLYALVSRTTNNRDTLASEEEIESAVDALEYCLGACVEDEDIEQAEQLLQLLRYTEDTDTHSYPRFSRTRRLARQTLRKRRSRRLGSCCRGPRFSRRRR